MNLRFPVIAAIVVAAAGAAAVRAAHPAATPAPFSTDAPARDGFPAPERHAHSPAAEREHIVVYVAGAVRKSGIYTLPPASRAIDAVRAAGGATTTADLVAINLAAELSDGDEIAVPAIGDTSDSVTAGDPQTPHRKKHKRARHKHKHRHHRRKPKPVADDQTADSSQADAAQTDAPTSVVDLNTAGESELETLPGVGSALAQRIVTFREVTGPFASTDDLLDVAGVTAKKLEDMQPYIVAGTQKESAP